MKELLDKLTSYNLFNYLLPGIIFVALVSKLTHYSFIQQDIIIGLFFYYFIGLVISRFGSLVVEPFLKQISFVHFANYKDFVSAAKSDEKIELLTEANNTYRTLCSMLVLLIVMKAVEVLEIKCPVLKKGNMVTAIILLLALFLFSYRKQTKYILSRIIIQHK